MSISSFPPQPFMPMTQPPVQASPNKSSPAKSPEKSSRENLDSQNQLQGERNDKSSGPDNTQAAPTKPPSEAVIAKMNKIADLLSRDNLIQMMRDPYSKETAQSLKDLRELVSPSSLNSLSRDPAEQAQLRAKVSEVLSEKNIHGLRSEAAAVPIPALTPERIRERTAKSDPQESYEASRQVEKELEEEKINIRHRTRQCQPLCKNLIAMGQPLSTQGADAKPELKPDLSANSTPRSKSAPQTFTSPSTPTAPVASPHTTPLEGSDREKPAPQTRPQAEAPSKPVDTNEVKTPSGSQPSPEALAKMRRLGELLSRENLIFMMQQPNSTFTAKCMRELDALLSEDSLNSLSSDPAEVAKLRSLISQVMSDANLQALLHEAQMTHVELK